MGMLLLLAVSPVHWFGKFFYLHLIAGASSSVTLIYKFIFAFLSIFYFHFIVGASVSATLIYILLFLSIFVLHLILFHCFFIYLLCLPYLPI